MMEVVWLNERYKTVMLGTWVGVIRNEEGTRGQ